jgi:uncharacterized protein with PIN domain
MLPAKMIPNSALNVTIYGHNLKNAAKKFPTNVAFVESTGLLRKASDKILSQIHVSYYSFDFKNENFVLLAMSKSANFRFYESLNDFLLPSKRNASIIYNFNDYPAIKHAIETIGVPHPEIDLILVNGAPVDFLYSLHNNDEAEVYPAFATSGFPESWSRTGQQPFPEKFILDVHLGKLARALRLFGFDTSYANNYTDKTIVQIAEAEKRIVLTRDVNLLKHKSVTVGYWLRSQFVEEQLTEVIKRFKLIAKFRPFERCVECNGRIIKVDKETILNKLLPKTILYYNDFFQCTCCKRIYWRGSHYEQMQQFIKRIEKLFA